jgi:flagellar M-ring protein FliF
MQDLYEAQLEMAADSMLAVALGPGRAVVWVTADLDFDEQESETVTYVTDDQVTLREQTLDEAFTGDNSVPLGTLGTAEDVTDAGELAGDSGSAYLRSETNSEFGVPSTRTVSRQAPGSVERITVAVVLDDSLDPAPDPAVLTPLVGAAVGLDPDRGDTIVVESFTFDASATEGDGDTAAALGTAAADGGLEPIVGYAKTGAAVIGMILALLFLRMGLKGLQVEPLREPVELDPTAVAEITGGGATATTAGAAAGGATGAAAGELTAGHAAQAAGAETTEISTVDMLQLIDNQSDEVAHLLRDLVAETA